MDNGAEEKLSKALMHLMRTSHNAFVVGMLLNLQKVQDNAVKAIELHGTTIKYNPGYVNGLSDNDVKFNLMHECWHLPFLDSIRAQSKDDKQLWNDACDHYINHLIKADTGCGVTVPSNAKCDPKYKGKEKEEIYQLLLLEAKKSPKNQPDKDPMSGDLGSPTGDDGKSPSPQDLQSMQDEIQNMVQQSAMQSKGRGGPVPDAINKWMEELYDPKLPWESILVKYMDSYKAEDYTYARLNKKFFPHGFILPTLYSEGLGDIVIANDESGSVSDKEYETYLGAIKNIKDNLNPSRIDVLNFTTKITSTHVIKEDDDISKIQFRGCGGTHIPCVFDYIEKMKMKPQVLILFSDMDSQMPKEKPSYDVIWIAVNARNFKEPFGRTIHVSIK